MTEDDRVDDLLRRIARDRADRADEDTDPGAMAMPSEPDPHPTVPYRVHADSDTEKFPTTGSGAVDHITAGHLGHHGEMLAEIRDNTKRSADADVAFLGVVHRGARWVRIAATVAGVSFGLGGLGALAMVVLWLILWR